MKKAAATTLPATLTTTPKRHLVKSSKGATPTAPTGTKQSRLIALLRTQPGATIAQMTTLTGWQPHTVRGTISSVLRKRLQLNVILDPGTRVYRVVEAPS